MANSARMVQSLQVKAGSRITIDEKQETQSSVPAADDAGSFTQDIPTTAGGTLVVPPASLGSFGWSMITNMDAANAVQFGRKVGGTFYPLFRASAGKRAGPIELDCPTNELYGLGIGGTVKVKFSIAEA